MRVVALALVALLTVTTTQAAPKDVAVIIGNVSYTSDVPNADFAGRDARMAARFAREVLDVPPANILHLQDAGQAKMDGLFGNGDDVKGILWH